MRGMFLHTRGKFTANTLSRLEYDEARSLYKTHERVLSYSCKRQSWYSRLVRWSLTPILHSQPEQQEDIDISLGRPERSPWTMACAYYVAMGGVVLPTRTELSAKPLMADQPTLTVTTMESLIRRLPDMVPSLVADDIAKFNKSSSITKTIICAQATWFCAQTIARLVQKEDISLLELNTLVHCACAFLMYGLWWHKPYDVTLHTTLAGRAATALTAAHMLGARLETITPKNKPLVTQTQGDPYYMVLTAVGVETPLAVTMARWTLQDASMARSKQDVVVTLCDGDLVPGTRFRVMLAPLERRSAVRLGVYQGTLDALKVLWDSLQHPDSQQVRRFLEDFTIRPRNMAQTRIENFRIDDLYGRAFGVAIAILAITNTVYGSLHAIPWYYGFSSPAESWLWRLSVVWIACYGPFIALSSGLAFVIRRLGRRTFGGPKARKLRNGILKVGGYGIFLPATGVCILARCFLIVECFVALPSSPETVYNVPSWSAYFPHIG